MIGVEAFLAQVADPQHQVIAAVICRLASLNRSLKTSARTAELKIIHAELRDTLKILGPLSESSAKWDSSDATHLAVWQISVLKTYILRNLPNPIKLSDLAMTVGLSSCQFGRLALRTFGMSPMRFLKLIRLEQAKRLLRETRLPFDEVADRCGFVGKSYFIRLFQEETGMTPRRWRICERI
jgi:AraC-like DNA-binding protein